jgi:glycosyltransferase involved in cell wall biosynthesis
VKVLMLGWEFPPYFAGGVGVVCHALTRALAGRGVEVTYVMPFGPREVSADHVRLLVASRVAPGIELLPVESALYPYAGTALGAGGRYPAVPRRFLLDRPLADREEPRLYGEELHAEIERFARQVSALAVGLDLDFDLIHAHDWTTFPAAMALRRLTGKPLVVHVHITEFDKSGGAHADARTYAIEKRGMEDADIVITVSNLVRERLLERYSVAPEKIRVVHNGIEHYGAPPDATPPSGRLFGDDKVVLFLGRVTLQKGPDYFIEAARRVLAVEPRVKFVMAGTGDMLPRMIERSAEAGIGERMVFAGFVDRDDAMRLFRRADLFVMPSVSEPFGIVPLEAMDQGAPVILSRQSGVAEVVRHAIKVDFWDVDDLASKMLAALCYPALAGELRRYGRAEAARLDWGAASGRVMTVYEELLRKVA